MGLNSTQKKETNVVELEIAVGAEELKAATDKVYHRKAKTIAVPGFRKGKAPRSIIEKMYGEGVFLEDAVNDLYPGAYEAAVEEAGIEPVDKADVEIVSLDKETGFVFKATVTVKPEVTIGTYKGIEAVKTLKTVTDADIEADINRMREQNARTISVEDRAAKDGDATVIDFEGFVDGVAFDGGKGDGYRLVLGSGTFIPGFEDQIAGHNVGDEFDVNVTFPEDYASEELKGKAAVFKVKLHEITEKELPALDDEFAKDVSEHDTLDALKEEVRTRLQETNDRVSKEQLENTLIEKVVETLEGDIPTCMFEHSIDQMANDFGYRLASQGLNLDMYLQYIGQDMETFRESFREPAERQVKTRLVLEKIAEVEKFEITDEDIDAECKRVGEAYGIDAEQVKKMIPAKDMIGDMKCSKALDLIRDSAKVTEKEAEAEKNDAAAEEPKPKKKRTTTKKTEPKAKKEPDQEAAADEK